MYMYVYNKGINRIVDEFTFETLVSWDVFYKRVIYDQIHFSQFLFRSQNL